MAQNVQLEIGREYEIKGYPKEFPETVRGRYLGEREGQVFFAFDKNERRFYVTTPAHFAEVNNGVVSQMSISSFLTSLFNLDDIKNESDKSRLVRILRDLGEKL